MVVSSFLCTNSGKNGDVWSGSWPFNIIPMFLIYAYEYILSKLGLNFSSIFFLFSLKASVTRPVSGIHTSVHKMILAGISNFSNLAEEYKKKLLKSWVFICLFVCVEVLRPSQPSGVMFSGVSLPNHTFTGQALVL